MDSINRKKFFTTTGLITAGYFIMRSFPFNLISKHPSQTVSVKINPQAVSRKKTGEKNV